ncbi:hypothetical protein G7Y29_04825 [Corynebacterium qintianiae]|uniref:YbjN domain-containing protein n=1 Tax=Corynebacterium qintianiae TaxID=2709392 RepID=A0A7T0KNU0_9CORY|nr:hypothetical protein [Corynebacterium qintianiae]QPK84095.1 hypothetical protein G7Y29_04825 [Corynebacterium qintianiae]
MTHPETHPPTRKNDLDRVREFFRANHYQFNETDSEYSLITAFSGITFEIRYTEPNIALVSTVAVDAITGDRFENVLEWVERYNNAHAFPSTVALKDDKRDLTAFGATYVLPGLWQYTDEQFADWMGSGIHGIVDAVTTYLEESSPEALAQLRQPAP